MARLFEDCVRNPLLIIAALSASFMPFTRIMSGSFGFSILMTSAPCTASW